MTIVPERQTGCKLMTLCSVYCPKQEEHNNGLSKLSALPSLPCMTYPLIASHAHPCHLISFLPAIQHRPYSPTPPPPLHLRCSQSSRFCVYTGTMDLLTRVNNEADSLISTLNSWRCRLSCTRLIKKLAWEAWQKTGEVPLAFGRVFRLRSAIHHRPRKRSWPFEGWWPKPSAGEGLLGTSA